MYLSKLSAEQKDLFLDLSIHAANSDLKVTSEELDIIDEYCFEMRLEESRKEVKRDLDTVLQELKKITNEREQNMILIEICALLLGDGVYDTMEKDFVKKIQSIFEISDSKIERMLNSINQLLTIYYNLNELIEN